MKLTKTITTAKKCSKCSGDGRLSYYSHIKAGECFRCNGTGFFGIESKEVALTDDEVLAILAQRGVVVELPEQLEAPEGEDWLWFMFTTDCPRNAAIEAARATLAAM
jgi:hypothetical protein